MQTRPGVVSLSRRPQHTGAIGRMVSPHSTARHTTQKSAGGTATCIRGDHEFMLVLQVSAPCQQVSAQCQRGVAMPRWVSAPCQQGSAQFQQVSHQCQRLSKRQQVSDQSQQVPAQSQQVSAQPASVSSSQQISATGRPSFGKCRQNNNIQQNVSKLIKVSAACPLCDAPFGIIFRHDQIIRKCIDSYNICNTSTYVL